MDQKNSKGKKTFNPFGQMPTYHDQVESICQTTKMMSDFMKKVQDMQMQYLSEVMESTTAMIGKMMSVHHGTADQGSSHVQNCSNHMESHIKKTMEHSKNVVNLLKSNHTKAQAFWGSKFKPH